MAQPRKRLIPEGTTGYYHCINRCVRQSWLCGLDSATGKSFEHRRGWIEERLRVLAECYAVSIYAYAVMSNHLHVVLKVDALAAQSWTDEEVAHRWCRVFRRHGPPGSSAHDLRIQEIVADPPKVAKYRERLMSLSWFMRCLVEPIARAANLEDERKGRFWEGRFKSQVLTNERSLLAAMAYADLNPIRAKMTSKLSQSQYTGVRQRILALKLDKSLPASPLKPVWGVDQVGLSVSVRQYLELVAFTGRSWHRKKDTAHVSARIKSVLTGMRVDAGKWNRQIAAFTASRIRVLGTCEAIIQIAKDIGQQWLCGIGLARRLA